MLFPIQVYQARKLSPYLLLYNSEIGLIDLSFICVCLFQMDISTYTVNEALFFQPRNLPIPITWHNGNTEFGG
jgi:hypothetical protein